MVFLWAPHPGLDQENLTKRPDPETRAKAEAWNWDQNHSRGLEQWPVPQPRTGTETGNPGRGPEQRLEPQLRTGTETTTTAEGQQPQLRTEAKTRTTVQNLSRVQDHCWFTTESTSVHLLDHLTLVATQTLRGSVSATKPYLRGKMHQFPVEYNDLKLSTCSKLSKCSPEVQSDETRQPPEVTIPTLFIPRLLVIKTIPWEQRLSSHWSYTRNEGLISTLVPHTPDQPPTKYPGGHGDKTSSQNTCRLDRKTLITPPRSARSPEDHQSAAWQKMSLAWKVTGSVLDLHEALNEPTQSNNAQGFQHLRVDLIHTRYHCRVF